MIHADEPGAGVCWNQKKLRHSWWASPRQGACFAQLIDSLCSVSSFTFDSKSYDDMGDFMFYVSTTHSVFKLVSHLGL